MASPRPVIRVRDAVPSDLDALIDVHFAAFEGDIMNRVMYPGGVSEDSRAKFGAGFFPSKEEQEGKPYEGETFTTVAERVPEDGSPAEVIAFAKWLLRREPLAEEVWKKPKPINREEFGEGTDMEATEAFLVGMHEKTAALMKGDPALYLAILVCHPRAHRCGAGTALLTVGVELADRESLPAYVESSPMGYQLYRRFGYEAVGVHDVRITERWGHTRDPGDNWGGTSAVELAGPLPEGSFRAAILKRNPLIPK